MSNLCDAIVLDVKSHDQSHEPVFLRPPLKFQHPHTRRVDAPQQRRRRYRVTCQRFKSSGAIQKTAFGVLPDVLYLTFLPFLVWLGSRQRRDRDKWMLTKTPRARVLLRTKKSLRFAKGRLGVAQSRSVSKRTCTLSSRHSKGEQWI